MYQQNETILFAYIKNWLRCFKYAYNNNNDDKTNDNKYKLENCWTREDRYCKAIGYTSKVHN
jgi:hypothetical protein